MMDQDSAYRPQLKIIDLGVDMVPKPLVLVVDDEPALQSLVFDTLSDDFRLIAAFNGREGVAKATQHKPNVILMDVMMPDIGGYEAVRILQNQAETKDIPILMVTAQDFDSSTIQLLKNEPNVAGLITKPFRPKALRETIRAVIDKKKIN